MYHLKYKLDFTSSVRVLEFNSLCKLIQQVSTDFKSGYFTNIDQLKSVTYNKDQSAMITVLDSLKYTLTGDLKDQVIYKLNYLKEGC